MQVVDVKARIQGRRGFVAVTFVKNSVEIYNPYECLATSIQPLVGNDIDIDGHVVDADNIVDIK